MTHQAVRYPASAFLPGRITFPHGSSTWSHSKRKGQLPEQTSVGWRRHPRVAPREGIQWAQLAPCAFSWLQQVHRASTPVTSPCDAASLTYPLTSPLTRPGCRHPRLQTWAPQLLCAAASGRVTLVSDLRTPGPREASGTVHHACT